MCDYSIEEWTVADMESLPLAIIYITWHADGFSVHWPSDDLETDPVWLTSILLLNFHA